MTWYHVEPDGSYHAVTIESAGRNLMQPIEERRVAHDEVAPGVEVSTVFLGLDHRLGGDGPPVLWETLITAPGHLRDGWCERYTSQADALRGHAVMVAEAQRTKRPH